jgi:single-stranded-DNA-specific exonuclease
LRYKLIEGSLNDTSAVFNTVLLNRGVIEPRRYLNLTDGCIEDYNNLNNIHEAVECFKKHLDNRDNISILVDCDPDDYTSAAMIYLYIQKEYPDYPVSYIIHQNNKVHGLSRMNNGDITLPKDTKLLIIPDAGTNDTEQCNQLIDSGVDVIILDHHEMEEVGKNNRAIIVNNQVSDNYTNKNFSGAGIVYEFLRALDEIEWTMHADECLDLVALAQVSDVMDLRSLPTRYYVNQGFQQIKNSMFKALVEAQDYSMNGKVNPTSVAWYVTPILNAMIRIGSYEERELLFRAFIEDYEEFDYKKRTGEVIKENIYDRVARLCKNVKSRQDKVRDKLYAELESMVDYNDKVSIIVAENTDSGIVGLSAMKLADSIKRPVVVLRDIGNGTLGGSLRNYDNSPIEDLKELLNQTGLFKAMGHANAAGAEIAKKDLQAAKYMLNEQLKDIVYDSSYLCDFVLDFDELDIAFIKEIDNYDWVWCTGIKEPVIAVTDICVTRKDVHLQGKNYDSVAFEHDGVKYVMFKMSGDNELLQFITDLGDDDDYIVFDAVVTCSVNSYGGVLQPQCVIKDINITKQNN